MIEMKNMYSRLMASMLMEAYVTKDRQGPKDLIMDLTNFG